MRMTANMIRPFDAGVGVEITPQLIKPSDDGSEVFYNYSVGDKYVLWFVQHQDDGHIYSVSMAPRRDVKSEFEFYISGAGGDDFYPNRFVARGPSRNMTADEMGQFIDALRNEQRYLWTVQRFFETGIHALKYWAERATVEVQSVNFGDYDLGGVEFTEDDYITIARRVMDGALLSDVVHQYFLEVRDVLDAGLEDVEEAL